MVRFFGMMPSAEIAIEKTFKTNSDIRPNQKARIQAGPNGWSIIWADGGSDYEDKPFGTEKNYENAYNRLLEYYPNAIEIA